MQEEWVAKKGEKMEAQKQKDLGLDAKLPLEVWSEIGKLFNNRLDITRFRSVCRTWRYSVPSLTHFPLLVPPPPGAIGSSEGPCFVNEDAYYRFEAEAEAEQDAEAESKVVVVLEDVNHGDECRSWRMANGFSRFSFLYKSHALKRAMLSGRHYRAFNAVRKLVIVSPYVSDLDPRYSPLQDLTAVVLRTGNLLALRLGNSHLSGWDWEAIIPSWGNFEDIISYKGKLYAVDRSGRVWVMDYPSLQMYPVWAVPCTSNLMRFVESLGQLFLCVIKRSSWPPVFKIFKQVQFQGQARPQCVEAQDLGDQVFFWCKDKVFSVPTNVFADIDLLNHKRPFNHWAPTYPKIPNHALVFSKPGEGSDQPQLKFVVVRVASKTVKPQQPNATSSMLAQFYPAHTALA